MKNINQLIHCNRSLLITILFVLFIHSTSQAQQQIVDTDFKPIVEKPAYFNDGPTVAIDEAHSNFHTTEGQYKPFTDLLVMDGYKVRAWKTKFEKEKLKEIDILVIVNARNLDALMAGDLTRSAFTEDECDAIHDWVYEGGSLLLIADHAPFGYAADSLGQRFGIKMGKGWAFDLSPIGGITTQLEFTRENNLLGHHIILLGRDSSEEIRNIKSFTGQSLKAPSEATSLMKLSETAREAPTPDALNIEDEASRTKDSTKYGNHSNAVGGQTQGFALEFGKGKVVALGEAGMFSAQIIRSMDGSEMKYGFNVPGNDNQQFALNIMHWLSGLLD